MRRDEATETWTEAEAPGVFLAPSQRAPLLTLLRGLQDREKLIVITGEAGVGKTTVLRTAVGPCEHGSGRIIWCGGTGGEPITLARLLMDAAGELPDIDLPEDAPVPPPLHGRHVIAVIDDAHLLTAEAAAYLVCASDFVAAAEGTLQVVLVGRPGLWDVLREAGIAGRVRLAGEMSGLPRGEADDYLRARLAKPFPETLSLHGRSAWTPAELELLLSWASGAQPAPPLPPAPETAPACPARPPFRSRAALLAAASAVALAGGGLYAARIAAPVGDAPLLLAQARAPAEPPVERAPGPAAVTAAKATPPAAATAPAEPPESAPEPAAAAKAAPPALPAPARVAVAAAPAAPEPAVAVPAAANAGARNAVAAASPAAIGRLLRSGEMMLVRGDVPAARALYERAAAANSAEAAAVVAKTYDPLFLSSIGAKGVPAQTSLAAHWYERAIELGSQEARARLAMLHATGGRSGSQD